MTVSFKQPSYTVNEEAGTLTVCVELSALSLDPTTVVLSDVPGTAQRGSVLLIILYSVCVCSVVAGSSVIKALGL